MKVTDVRLRLKEEAKLKAICSVTFDDCFVVRDIKVIEGQKGLFISMPNKKVGEDHVDIAHPIVTETREEIKNAVLSAYEKALAEKTETTDAE